MLVCGALIVLLVLVGGAAGPALVSFAPLEVNTSDRLKPPGWATDGQPPHLLGTDNLGRDIASRILWGTRASIGLSLAAVALAGTVGISFGLLSGYYGGPLDDAIMRLADVQLTFPVIVLALAVIAVVGSSVPTLIAVMSLSGWVVYARTVRATTLSIKEREYVEAARAAGASDARLLLHHVLPNAVAAILVVATFQLASMIILESSLSFFGLGVKPPEPSLGGMLSEGRDYVMVAWWLAAFPGLAISLTVLGANLLGDGARDVLDPQLRVG